jgi:hypothetical protein
MKKLLLTLLIILSLVITACGEGEVSADNTRSFLGGTTGLAIEFVEGEPPTEVVDGGNMPFTTTVKLMNKGEWAVLKEDVTITLKGFDSADFGVTTADLVDINPAEDILKNDINPDTGDAINAPDVYVTFATLNFMRVLSGNQEFPFVVDACYQYGTIANAKLCIKENLLDTTNEDVCIVSGKKDIENSGGPLQAITFDEFTAGQDAVSFTVTLKDQGTGKLAALGSGCDQTPANKGVVKITVDTGLADLFCSGLTSSGVNGTAFYGNTKLTVGEKPVRCTQPIADKSDKIKIVDVTLEYDYLESAATTVLIKHI